MIRRLASRILTGASYLAIGTAGVGAVVVLSPGILAFAVLQRAAEWCDEPRDAWARREVRR